VVAARAIRLKESGYHASDLNAVVIPEEVAMPTERISVSLVLTLLTVALEFGLVACSREETPTEPSVTAGPALATVRTYPGIWARSVDQPERLGASTPRARWWA
jgi:hypothetical protein